MSVLRQGLRPPAHLVPALGPGASPTLAAASPPARSLTESPPLPVSEASVAASIQRQDSLCHGTPISQVTVTCGYPYTFTTNDAEPEGTISYTGNDSGQTSAFYVNPATGAWDQASTVSPVSPQASAPFAEQRLRATGWLGPLLSSRRRSWSAAAGMVASPRPSSDRWGSIACNTRTAWC